VNEDQYRDEPSKPTWNERRGELDARGAVGAEPQELLLEVGLGQDMGDGLTLRVNAKGQNLYGGSGAGVLTLVHDFSRAIKRVTRVHGPRRAPFLFINQRPFENIGHFMSGMPVFPARPAGC